MATRASAFGGMRFVGLEGEQLVFVRFRELFPEDRLSPARSHTMRLDPRWVAALAVDGRHVWPGSSQVVVRTFRSAVDGQA